MSSFSSVDSRSRFHLPISLVEGVVVEVGFVLLNAFYHWSLGLANVEGLAVKAGNGVDGVGSTISRRRGFGLGEDVPESSRGREGDVYVVAGDGPSGRVGLHGFWLLTVEQLCPCLGVAARYPGHVTLTGSRTR